MRNTCLAIVLIYKLSIGAKIGDHEIMNDLERQNGPYFALFCRIW